MNKNIINIFNMIFLIINFRYKLFIKLILFNFKISDFII